MRRKVRQPAGLLFLAVLAIAANVIATHYFFTVRFPGANDFYPRWRGAQLFWQDGLDPYSEEVTRAIQEGIYGRVAQPDEDQVLFAYPFYVVLFLFPLAWLSYSWVQAIWLVFLEFSLLVGVFLTLDILRWRLSRWLTILTALWTLVFYHSTRTIFLGQFAGAVFLTVVITVWCLQKKWDIVAGVALAMTTFKPQMSVLIVPALLLWGLGRQRWRFLVGFGVSMGVLVGVSFALVPGWVVEFLQQMTLYPSYTAIGSPVWILTHYYAPGLGLVGEIGFSGILLCYSLVQWRHLWREEIDSRLSLWVIGLTLVVTNLIVTRTATTNYVVLYVPLFLALGTAVGRMRRPNLFLVGFYGGSVLAMWWLFLGTVVVRYEHPIMYLPLPLGLLLVFVLGRPWLVKTDSESAQVV